MKRKHILYLGLTLLISIVVSIIFEYYPTISNINIFRVVALIFIVTSVLSLVMLVLKNRDKKVSLLNMPNVLDNVALLLVITGIEFLIINCIIQISFFAAFILIVFVVVSTFIIIAINKYDFESGFVPSLIIIFMLCFLFINFFQKEIEDYSTTRGEPYIVKHRELTLFSNGKYTIYNTTANHMDKEVRDLPFDVNDPFAQYILKNINKDLKVVLTHYDKEQHTYKIMYDDESIQIFKLEDVKMDKELATDSVLKFLEGIEKESKEVAEKKKLKEQVNKLINS